MKRRIDMRTTWTHLGSTHASRSSWWSRRVPQKRTLSQTFCTWSWSTTSNSSWKSAMTRLGRLSSASATLARCLERTNLNWRTQDQPRQWTKFLKTMTQSLFGKRATLQLALWQMWHFKHRPLTAKSNIWSKFSVKSANLIMESS